MNIERKNRYKEKIAHLDRYLDLLTNWIGANSDSAKIQNRDTKDLFALYHAFQLSMEVIADLSSMVVKDSKRMVKDDYLNYQFLKEINIIPESLAKQIKDLNGLRNRIVHDYNGLVDIITIDGILEAIKLLPQYKECIIKWLEKQ